MKKETKKFVLDIRDRMFKSNIKDACMNFMRLHPEMFSDTMTNDGKVMSIVMSVAIVCKEEEISTDPGFITISVDKENNYSEHFETGARYWNNELEEENND